MGTFLNWDPIGVAVKKKIIAPLHTDQRLRTKHLGDDLSLGEDARYEKFRAFLKQKILNCFIVVSIELV